MKTSLKKTMKNAHTDTLDSIFGRLLQTAALLLTGTTIILTIQYIAEYPNRDATILVILPMCVACGILAAIGGILTDKNKEQPKEKTPTKCQRTSLETQKLPTSVDTNSPDSSRKANTN